MNASKSLITISLINPFTLIIFLAFFIAKIFNLIDWAWIWVFSPLWIPLTVILSIIAFGGILYLGIYLTLIIIDKWKL